MPYGIVIFNQETINHIDEGELLNAVTESSFQTLCKQYRLSPDLFSQIEDQPHVNLLMHDDLPVFQLAYRPSNHLPLTVYRWPADSQDGRTYMVQMQNGAEFKIVQEYFARITQVVVIEIDRSQLEDFGILLAYEIARWAAFSGKGIMHALDGKWYRLNENKAFLPIGSA